MAHLGTIHLQLRDHAVIMFSSGCSTLQRSPKAGMHSEASFQDRDRTQKQTNADLDVFSLQKRGFQNLNGSHIGKYPLLFSLASREES